ncbi:Type I restriction-modification system, restriction subunit R [Candidatus Promineifilum breve]|uniref:Type I restriction-modification system, restriction subunit R n=1 Tax=Candidatus Promineifilum breve TaxID=1806508 RepID=A0A160SXM1_9CHLR|nr:type I restriction endonuclease subunit R [Candidatus Promineifilum breve]CUS01886.2 Type I restriction-modification system, restriction subunit R [Candidatus Promineifilum breve]
MPHSDTSEKELERIIVAAMIGRDTAEDGRPPAAAGESLPGLGGYVEGNAAEYDRDHAVDLGKLLAFLHATQPAIVEQFDLEKDGPRRKTFLNRLQGEIARRGVIDVLRKGLKHGPADVDLFYGAPTPGNVKAERLYRENVFSVTRQLQYSKDATKLALDLCLFINGLPVFTFELKNRLTKQTVEDAVEQYRRDRDPRELLFQFKRCVAHFAVDDQEVRFCTELKGKASWFLPFNRGYQDGRGNPPNPEGLKTAYLWERILSREGLTDILENYAQVVAEKDDRSGKKREKQIFPRYHQLDVVRALLADAAANGAGRRYLIQHSAGSGKSNSIAWLAHQLVGLEQGSRRVFDSVVVVTDRRVLDKQIKDTIKQFAQVSSVVGHAERSGDLRRFISEGKKIIITTVQKFPFVVNEIGDDHRGRTFAILIDEAHSSQSGRTAGTMNETLADVDENDYEDEINRVMESRKMLPNAGYFAFTATPKNKTLEIFGESFEEGGVVKRRPFHSYTMKQAIQEGFILDVLQNYTPVACYYRLIKKVADDPEFDINKAQKKLRRYVEGHQYAIRQKAEIMVDHFHEQVIAKNKIGGQARAMVVTGGIRRAIDYFHAIRAYLQERKSPYQAIVAFSGEHEYGGAKVSEASLNGFSSNLIAEKIQEDPYRFLVVADKFQTGYDEPLLHTMYVDKILSGIKAVQTLSRLNRAHPQKHDTFILDFANDADTIQASFEPYYRTTILSEETDPNKLHDLKAGLDGYQVYDWEQVAGLVNLYLGGADRDKLDPILDSCVAVYNDLDEDGQVDFKSKAKAFVRTYNFLSSILPYSNADWERLATFLNFLIPKLPAPREDDLSKGILEAIDMDSYRAEVRSTINIALADEDAEIGPVPVEGGGYKAEQELDRLSSILQTFNDIFGSIEWRDVDKIGKVISEEIPNKVAADQAYQNAMKNSDKQNARIEHDFALQRVILSLLADHAELNHQFSDNPSFKKWLADTVFAVTYETN